MVGREHRGGDPLFPRSADEPLDLRLPAVELVFAAVTIFEREPFEIAEQGSELGLTGFTSCGRGESMGLLIRSPAMDASSFQPAQPSRLRLLLEHFSRIEDKRSPERVAHRLDEVLLVCVCATIADCDSFDAISDWGNAHLEFLRRFLPYDWGVPSGRWLNLMMNRIDPALFAACFMDWVLDCWPEPLDAIAIDGKTVRRSHDRSKGRAALHLVSAFATSSQLALGQEAVADKSNETTAIPLLLEKLAADRSLEGALISIDAIACNPPIAQAIRAVGADYLLAVKGNQPTLRPTSRPPSKPPPRARSKSTSITTRATAASRPAPSRSAPGRLARRRPALSRRGPVSRRARHRQSRSADRVEGPLPVRHPLLHHLQRRAPRPRSGATIRGHWGIENPLHWTLDVTFQEDLSRVRKGHGAQNMALVRKFALNKLRAAPQLSHPPNLPVKPCRRPTKPPRPKSLKLRRKIASWDVKCLAEILTGQTG